ncbi:MAG: hypothetical protein R3B13_21960 [Polyangiaceae bacterium]
MSTDSTRALGHAAILFVALFGLFSIGCSSADDSPSPASGAKFGAPCQRTEDCASGLCVRRDASGGICTRTCTLAAECPDSPNWGCVSAENFAPEICACVPDASVEICNDGIDNECNGRVDDCLDCNGVQIPQDDPNHCGSCDNACRADQLCTLGECVCAPETPFECNAQCVNLETNPQHCGACGNSCPPAQTCVNGVCSCPSTLSPDYCAGTGCVDLTTDSANCGTCDKVCPTGQSCVASKCECPNSLQTHCPGVGCINLSGDVANCGSCGNKCPTGAGCFNGTCACPAGQKDLCSDVCVDLLGDESNCGACGNKCAPTQQCLAGTCQCLPGVLCNGVCSNTYVDVSNCGTCGNKCASGQSCTSGACTCPAAVPDVCGGACVNTQTNSAHCGACNKGCPSGQVCKLGACACYAAGQTPCPSGCTDTQTDGQNCGACGKVCPAAQTCIAGACSCGAGKTWCEATSTCVTTTNDPANCGSCGKKCESGQLCSNSNCVCPNYNEKWCAAVGGCTDVYSNSSHCGDCDKACPAATHCSFANCLCDQAGQALCGTTCHDFLTDATHCGSCTKACAANEVCTGGKCMCPSPIVGTALRLTTNNTHALQASAVWNGTHIGVVYVEDVGGGSGNYAHAYFALLNPDGTRAKTPDLLISNKPMGYARHPDITWSGTEFGVVFLQASSTSSGDVHFLRLAPDGTPKAPAVNISTATAGAALPDGAPRIIWSPVYGGYALASGGHGGVGLQRIGTDGSAPEPVNITPGGTVSTRTILGLSSSGEWAVAFKSSYAASLAFYNADGSKTKPVSNLTSWTYSSSGLDMVYDGSTWVTWWVEGYVDIMVNRGATANTPFAAVKLAQGNYPRQLEAVASGGGAFELVEMRDDKIQLYRFALSQSGPTSLTPLTAATAVLGTPSALSIEAVAAGPGKLLVLWSDNRWGAAELYAAPVDLQGCP